MPALLIALALSTITAARAEDSQRTRDGWMLDRWSVEDGLPLDHLNALAVDGDGYLWIATYDGLVRFDGTRFDVLRAGDVHGPPSSRIVELAVHPIDGALWLRDEQGAIQRRTSTHTTLVRAATGGDSHIALGHDTVWVVADGDLYRTDSGLIDVEQRVGAVKQLGEQLDGDLWLTTDSLHVLPADGGPLQHVPLAASAHPPLLQRRADGRLEAVVPPLFGEPTGLPALPATSEPRPSEWTFSKQWVYIDGERIAEVGNEVVATAEQSDTLWLATRGSGLARVRPSRASSILPPGSQSEERWSQAVDMLQVDASGVWAHSEGVGWWSAHHAGRRRAPPPWPDAGPLPWALRDGIPIDSNTWVRGATLYVDDVAIQDLSDPMDLASAAWTPSQDVISVGFNDAVATRERGVWQHQVWTASATPIRPRTGLWKSRQQQAIGSSRGLFLLDADGRPVQRLAAPTRHLVASGELVWIATESLGLCVVNSAPFWDLTQPLNPHCSGSAMGVVRGIHSVVMDPWRRAWLTGNLGIGVVSAQVVQDFAAARRADLPAVWLGVHDGLAHSEMNGIFGSGAALGPDGLFYAASQAGVAVVDPAAITLPEPPVASIQVPGDGVAKLAADATDLQVHWSVPPLPWSEQAEFRYRLGNNPWSAATSERVVRLAAIPPGHSDIQVQARIGGEWGPSAILSIWRRPRLSERGLFWFGLASAALIAVMAAAAHRVRAAQTQRRVLESVVEQRTLDIRERNRELRNRTEQLRARNHEVNRQKERLVEHDGHKRRWLAQVSHELRTPLALIQGPLQDVFASLPADSPPAKTTQAVLANVAHLSQLVDSLFQLSRAQAGGLRLRARRVDLNHIINEVAERFHEFAERGGITLRTASTTRLIAWADAEMLHTALSNLIANAIRHTPRDGAITISLDRSDSASMGDAARIEVRDTGPGIDTANVEHIFEHFVQGVGDEVGAAGVGLPLVRELIELHGGDVRAVPNERGACFVVRIPLGSSHITREQVANTAASPGSKAVPLGEQGAPVLLLVEDHRELAAWMASHLVDNFRIVHAQDGDEGFAAARQQRPDIIVSDIMMPRCDGLTMVRQLRADPSTATVPVLFVSAKGDLDDRLVGLEIGDDYLSKPFMGAELLARAVALLRRAGPSVPPPPEQAPALPESAVDFIESLQAAALNNASDVNFGVAELARAVATSPRTLQKRLAALDYPTPAVWLRTQRLHIARDLLRRGTYETVAEVAAAVGMSRAYFSRAYTAQFGASPSSDNKTL